MIIEHHDPIDESTSAEVHLVRLDDHVLVVASGELDADNVGMLRQALAAIDDVPGAPRVVVDMSRLRFFDATTLGALLAASAAARRRGGSLRIVSISAFGRRILRLLALDVELGLERVTADVGTGDTVRPDERT